MSTPEGRSVARRARIARQFRQTHGHAEKIIRRRLMPFWRAVTADIMAKLSRAHSPNIYIDQIFIADDWRPLFNAALMPGIQTAIYTGVSFESEWVRSATGETTQQSIAKLHSIQQENFSQDFRKEDLGGLNQGEGFGVSGGGVGGKSNPSPWLTIQRGNLPDIGVELTAELEAEVRRFLDTRNVGVWASVGPTTRTALQETILRGLKEGDSLEQITKRIQGTLTHYSDYEARRIARTETTAAMNFGQHAERTELGIEHKEWVSTIDNRTRGAKGKDRFDHLSPMGQTTQNDVPFIVSAESLMFPGDTSLGASGGNVIHCRCCAVGAWPNDTLTGGKAKGKSGTGGSGDGSEVGGGGTPRPRRPSKAESKTLEELGKNIISNKVIDALTAERTAAATKQQVKQITAILAKHDTKLEEIRQKALKIPVQMRAAERETVKLTSETENLHRAYLLAKASGDKAETARLLTKVKESLKKLEKAGANLAELADGGRKAIQKILKFQARPDIELEFASDVTLEMQAKAKQAKEFLRTVVNTQAKDRMAFKVEKTEKTRSYYHPPTQTLYMSKSVDVGVYVHEMGHGLEIQGDYVAASKGLIYKRTPNDVPLVLRRKYPRSKFTPDEVSLEDEFYRGFQVSNRRKAGAYVGKYYDGATEIISMGLELLYNDPIGFARRDPEYFKFIVGVTRGLVKIP